MKNHVAAVIRDVYSYSFERNVFDKYCDGPGLDSRCCALNDKIYCFIHGTNLRIHKSGDVALPFCSQEEFREMIIDSSRQLMWTVRLRIREHILDHHIAQRDALLKSIVKIYRQNDAGKDIQYFDLFETTSAFKIRNIDEVCEHTYAFVLQNLSMYREHIMNDQDFVQLRRLVITQPQMFDYDLQPKHFYKTIESKINDVQNKKTLVHLELLSRTLDNKVSAQVVSTIG